MRLRLVPRKGQDTLIGCAMIRRSVPMPRC